MIEVEAKAAGKPYVLIRSLGARGLRDIDSDMIIALYKAHGALLLRGFPADISGFADFAAQFCGSSVHNESLGRETLDDLRNIQSVNKGVVAFPLHPELSREPWKPDVCFFHCLKPPRLGGETTICDGVEIASGLPEDVLAEFSGRRLLYIQGAYPEVLQFWLGTATPTDSELANPPAQCPYSFLRVNEREIARSFSRPALHKPMFANQLAFGNFLLFGRYMRGQSNFPVFENGEQVSQHLVATAKAISDSLTAEIHWQVGDLLMIDNSRFMHGRNAIFDPDERLIASYFGYLNFAKPDPEEPLNPLWRQAPFFPPHPKPLRRPA